MTAIAKEHHDWVADRFAEARLSLDPSPHLIVRNALPPSLYASMMEKWPSPTQMHGHPDQPDRRRLVLNNPGETAALESSRSHWDYVTSVAENALGPAIKEAFAAVLARRFLENGAQVEYDLEVALYQDSSEFVLGPHLDMPDVAITTLIFCPDGDAPEELGTNLFNCNSPAISFVNPFDTPPGLFTSVLAVPYKANTLFAFANSLKSFHGLNAELLRTIRRTIRRSLFIQFNIGNYDGLYGSGALSNWTGLIGQTPDQSAVLAGLARAAVA